ncbi:MAG: ABC transporter permease [Bacteroidetes bacterium]|nr:ABC transporter permease [Bacteroidota bacterium]MDA1118917.1 ABC transporter permease [Bacteroidota bacterium]
MIGNIKPKHIAVTYLTAILLVLIFADFIANDKPIITIGNNGIQFFEKPVDAMITYQLNPLVKYKGKLDLKHTNQNPFLTTSGEHFLGTDHLGRDVLGGIIHGSRISIGIGFLAIFVAASLGILIGGISGFVGDQGFAIPFKTILIVFLLIVFYYYFIIHLDFFWVPFLIGCGIISGTYLALKNFKLINQKVTIPVDFILLKFSELFSSIPGYFLILTIITIVEPSLLSFSLIIGITSWVSIARLIRGEMIHVRNAGYIESARALGFSQTRIFFTHALPNSLGPLPYAFTFGLAGIMIVESTLSYFGIGLPADLLSWGNLISGFKNNTTAWWVAAIPGSIIFLTILSLHIVGRWVDEKMNSMNTTWK